jgi:hypothetical protein
MLGQNVDFFGKLPLTPLNCVLLTKIELLFPRVFWNSLLPRLFLIELMSEPSLFPRSCHFEAVIEFTDVVLFFDLTLMSTIELELFECFVGFTRGVLCGSPNEMLLSETALDENPAVT